ncbi:MAG: hypothetical protein II936_08015 [Oscillospiraceae bacterium]|nr:hypothetical protein [Oscillospiraceae bacterium]
MTNLEEMSNASSDTGYNRIPPNYSDRLSRSRREISFRSDIDIETEMTISFLDACKGGKKNIEVNKKEFCTVCTGSGKNFDVCPDCKGTGIEKTVRKGIFGKENIPCQKCGGSRKIAVSSCPRCKGSGSTEALCTVELNIPAGIDDGQTLVVRGQGNVNVANRSYGDLRVLIKVTEHPVFRRNEYDIHVDVPVSEEQCRKGGQIKVPCIHGDIIMSLPENTKYKTVFRLKGKGIMKLNQTEQGDEFVRIVAADSAKFNEK